MYIWQTWSVWGRQPVVPKTTPVDLEALVPYTVAAWPWEGVKTTKLPATSNLVPISGGLQPNSNGLQPSSF